MSTVLVPDSNEDSVDIYDGLDFNPSSNTGNGRYFLVGVLQHNFRSRII